MEKFIIDAEIVKNIATNIIFAMDIAASGDGSIHMREEIRTWLDANPSASDTVRLAAFNAASDKDKHDIDHLRDHGSLAGFIEHRLTDLIKKRTNSIETMAEFAISEAKVQSNSLVNLRPHGIWASVAGSIPELNAAVTDFEPNIKHLFGKAALNDLPHCHKTVTYFNEQAIPAIAKEVEKHGIKPVKSYPAKGTEYFKFTA